MSHRIKFFIIHLLTSFFIISISIGIVFFIWYPSPLAKALGVTNIFIILFAVDMVIGPLLTLLVYKEGKKTLKFDLTVIIVIQLVAFIYGFYIISQGRPAWIVFNTYRFDTITVNEIDQRKIIRSPYQVSPYLGPKWAALVLPQDLKKKNDIIEDAIFSGVDIVQRPNLYVPLMKQKQLLQRYARPIAELSEYNSSHKIAYQISQFPEATAWLPLRARSQDMVVLINKQTGQVVKIVDLRPWK